MNSNEKYIEKTIIIFFSISFIVKLVIITIFTNNYTNTILQRAAWGGAELHKNNTTRLCCAHNPTSVCCMTPEDMMAFRARQEL
jgi:hypothetical protein